MQKVKNRVHMGSYNDETPRRCQWHLAEAHYLESWGDARAFDGTVSIIQPLIQPLYQGRSPHGIAGSDCRDQGKTALDLIKDYWKTQPPRISRPSGRSRFTTVWSRNGASAVAAEQWRSRAIGRTPNWLRPLRQRRPVRNRFPARSQRSRRTLCQQRLAAGMPEANQQNHLGQFRHYQRRRRLRS